MAILNDDGSVGDRLLDCRNKHPLSCLVYSDSLKAKRAADPVRRGATELMDWPCQQHERAEAVFTAEADLSAA